MVKEWSQEQSDFVSGLNWPQIVYTVLKKEIALVFTQYFRFVAVLDQNIHFEFCLYSVTLCLTVTFLGKCHSDSVLCVWPQWALYPVYLVENFVSLYFADTRSICRFPDRPLLIRLHSQGLLAVSYKVLCSSSMCFMSNLLFSSFYLWISWESGLYLLGVRTVSWTWAVF